LKISGDLWRRFLEQHASEQRFPFHRHRDPWWPTGRPRTQSGKVIGAAGSGARISKPTAFFVATN